MRLAAAIKRARDRLPRCSLAIGLPLPNEVTETVLWLDADSEEEIAFSIARFVVRAETIEQLIQAEITAGRSPLDYVQAIPTDSEGFLLRWMDREVSLHKHEVPSRRGLPRLAKICHSISHRSVTDDPIPTLSRPGPRITPHA